MDSLLSSIEFLPFTPQTCVLLIIILVLLSFSAIMSSSETAFFSLSPADYDEIETNEDKKPYSTIAKLLSNPEKLLASILLMNNASNIAIAVLSVAFIQNLVDFGGSVVLEFVVQTVIITFILLLFAEIMPKIYASQKPLKVSRNMANVIYFTQSVVSPISNFLVSSTSVINKRMKSKNPKGISVDNLSHAIDLTNNLDDEQKILRSIALFGNLAVNSVMTARLDIVAFDIRMNFSDVVDKIVETGYSRIPVFEKSLDQIKGVLYIKDLIPHINKTNAFKWQTLVRPAVFVPETQKIDDLLLDFQRNKVHIATVVDEFGGTLGIVTMEDILEEIIGEIADEYDEDDNLYKKIDQNTYEFEAKILLNDFFKITDISPDELEDFTIDVDTLAGLILELWKEIPHVSEYITFGRYTFTILAMDKRRIKTIKLEIAQNQ